MREQLNVDRYTIEKGRRTQRPKPYDSNNKDVDNRPYIKSVYIDKVCLFNFLYTSFFYKISSGVLWARINHHKLSNVRFYAFEFNRLTPLSLSRISRYQSVYQKCLTNLGVMELNLSHLKMTSSLRIKMNLYLFLNF